jgi:hypothetical protein
MSKKHNKRELSADAEALRLKVLNVREEILTKIAKKTRSAKYRYLEENGGTDTPEGFISLNTGVVFYSHNSDGNLNEVIVGIHTDDPKIQTDVQGEISIRLLSDVHDLDLINIISELDQQLKNPETIDIVTEDDY